MERAFRVQGMDCADEIASLRAALSPWVEGEDRLEFDLLRGRMVVRADPEVLTTEEILSAVSRTGMVARPWGAETGAAGPRVSRRQLLTACLAGASLFLAFVTHTLLSGGVLRALSGGGELTHQVPLPAIVLYALCILVSLRFVLPKAWAALRSLRPDMNLLMTIAVIGAIALGEWFEAATVSFLFAFALHLESWSVGRARRAVEALLESAPTTVRLRSGDGMDTTVSPEEVPVGATFFVRPGERIALDGTVKSGESDVDQAPITGESVPVPKGPGDDVFAGTLNGDGALVVQSTRTADRTTLANIVRLVTEARSRRAPSERWVERFALRYTPAVLLLALTIFVAPPLLFGGDWAEWFYRSLVLLVIACPCALVISTPVAIVAGLTAASRHGVLVKGGMHLESPARLRAIAVDKTGTLTEGRPSVVSVRPLNDHSEGELLARAAALESQSNHPLARAIVGVAEERGVVIRAPDRYRAVPGRGAHGEFEGREYWLGSHRYLVERGQETDEVRALIEAATDESHTVVIVGTADHVCGIIALADRPRPEAAAAMAALRATGVRHLAVLTGDNAATANAVARAVGLTEVHAELLPEEKLEAVERLVREHGSVAMVGDGVNDAPAMAASTLSVAMGAAGSDTAIETADIALMSDDLGRLPWLIHHSRRTLATIRLNISLALGVKAAFVLLTLAGHATLWAAIAADMGASLLVTMNGLRLLRIEGGA